jgi:hypothetical protein
LNFWGFLFVYLFDKDYLSLLGGIMKFKTGFVSTIALGLFLVANLLAQKPADMEGTWSGLATLEGMAEPNELVLVLEQENGKLAGHMTDQYGTMNESPIDEIELADGMFHFSVKGMGPNAEEITILFKMQVDGDSMEGTLEIADMGWNGTWEATKQK